MGVSSFNYEQVEDNVHVFVVYVYEVKAAKATNADYLVPLCWRAFESSISLQ